MDENNQNKNFYQLPATKVIESLDSSEEGLTQKEAKKRLEKEGSNRLPKKKGYSALKTFFKQFQNPLIYILLFAGLITLGLKEYTDTIVIFGAVFFNVAVGFFQERKASKALEKLKNVLTFEAVALRDSHEQIVPQENLVPGDIITLTQGDKVPADARIINATDFKVDESTLTGEWKPAKKKTHPLEKETPLADRDNMVYMGTPIESGEATAVVVATGRDTELGRIAVMVSESKEEKTPYQKRLERFSKMIGIAVGIISIGIFAEGVFFGGEIIEMFETAIAIAVASVPEGLPVAMTVILAIGMQRILEKKGLVRKLVSAETLGSTSIICTDKTGTLTQAKMSTEAIYNVEGKEIGLETSVYNQILEVGTLNNEAFIENPKEESEEWILRGDSTEKAILAYAVKKGFRKEKFLSQFPRLAKVPFNSTYKYSASLNKKGGEYQISVLGAPEKILEKAQYFQVDGEVKEIDPSIKKQIKETNNKLTSKGLRVVAVGYRKTNENSFSSDLRKDVKDLVFLGFIGLHDPIRKDVKEAITTCKKAGMRPIIVTGDHKLTAKSVAEEIGFKIKEGEIMTGNELSQISKEDFENTFEDIKIYARVEPAQKMRIIEAWQEKGEVVAMTGDGVNDGPAIKKADIGIAQGSGTDVAKEVADLVLLNDSFSIIVAAIEEGRAILSNIRRVITYLLTGSLSEIVLISVSIFAGWPLPIAAVQILWINLVEDGLPSISLTFEPKEEGLMKEKPIPRNAPLLTGEMKTIIFIISIITDLLLLGTFWWLYTYFDFDFIRIRTIMFAALSLDSIFYIFACRSLNTKGWDINFFRNKFLIGAVIMAFVILLLGVYLPFFQTLLGTVPLKRFGWTIIVINAIINLGAIEITKWFFIVREKKSKKFEEESN